MTETMNRVQMAAHHWQPRFVANGIDVNDFEDVLGRTIEWSDWGPNWRAVGAAHEARGRDAERLGRAVSAVDAYQRAAWCYHLGKFLWFEDPALHAELRDRSVAVYAKTLARLDPPAERIEIPFEDHIIPDICAAREELPRRRSCSSSRVLIRPRRRCSPPRTSSCVVAWRR